jgi:hypothetical protein
MTKNPLVKPKGSLANLQSALTPKAKTAALEPVAPDYYKPPSRAGKMHLSAWLAPEYKTSLRAIQVKHPEKNLQDLFSEALNDLFSKYNVPVVREE